MNSTNDQFVELRRSFARQRSSDKLRRNATALCIALGAAMAVIAFLEAIGALVSLHLGGL